ncbi:MAG: Nif3-like dinuclear metal center hexameric protein [Dysgonomonas sp.]
MKIREVLSTIEQFAPLALQENFDNSGLQVGDVNQEVSSILLCIDVTESVIEEAVVLGCNLIISHHPIAFKPFKSLTGRNYVERCIIKAIQNNIVLYAAHTNLDNAFDGINSYLAGLLNLQQTRILQPMQKSLCKLITFVPDEHLSAVRNALFNVGAGCIGDYDSCSYSSHGEGTFRAGEGTNPFCGQIGELHTESESRLEVVFPSFKTNEVIQALIAVHPYEEPAYDIYQLQNSWAQAGSGIVGTLEEPMEEEEFLYYLKDVLNLNVIHHSRYARNKVKDVAICSGSGAFLIPSAINYGADVFITGEAKYNDYYDVEDKILLAVVGHYESEIFTKDVFFELLSKKYPNFAIHKSGYDENPVKYL